MISSLDPNDIKELERRGQLATFPSATVMYLAFNLKKPPFDDPKWRKAVASAIDRHGLARVLGKMVHTTTSYLPTLVRGDAKVDGFSDAKAMAEILNITKKPLIQIGYSPTPVGDLVIQKIQNDLKNKLGLEIAIQKSEWKVYLSQLETDAPAIYYAGVSAEYDDPMNHLRHFTMDFNSDNQSKYRNPQYQELVKKISGTPIGKERMRMIAEAQKMLVQDDTVLIPLFEKVLVFGVSKKILHFKTNPFSVVQLNQLGKID